MSDQKSTKMRAFAGNSYEDYYDHAMADFPWTARLVMNIVVAACWAFTKLVWPWKIEEAELLTKDARGRVIIQNHESMVEPVIMVVTPVVLSPCTIAHAIGAEPRCLGRSDAWTASPIPSTPSLPPARF